tara:strand:+ start:8806 stop:9087 length:282 start_codon:yes stop_codon:yes gene_type:complete
MQGGIINITLDNGGQQTLTLPAGAITFYVSGNEGIKVYTGNNTDGGDGFIITASSIGGNTTIENFVGGQYTFVEFGGRTIQIAMWCQGLGEFV